MSARIRLRKGSAKKIMTHTRWIALRKRWKESDFGGGAGGLRSHFGNGLVEIEMFGLPGLVSMVAMHVASREQHPRHGAAPHQQHSHECDPSCGELAPEAVQPHADRGGEHAKRHERTSRSQPKGQH